jgi:hypothetical protein
MNTTPQKREATMEPVDDAVDHIRGPAAGPLIVEYGDYECPYSRKAFREIERMRGTPRFSSTAWCTAGATTPLLCWR